jgi:hypothetical protein
MVEKAKRRIAGLCAHRLAKRVWRRHSAGFPYRNRKNIQPERYVQFPCICLYNIKL